MIKKLTLLVFILIFSLSSCDSVEVPYQLSPLSNGETIAILKTSMGDIKIRFFPNEAPKAVENFIRLSEQDYYDGLLFHRVIKDFMIQGGDPLGTGVGGDSIWQRPFEDEFSENLHHFRGALAMANNGDPNTNRSQFFIVQTNIINDRMLNHMKSEGFSPELTAQYKKYKGAPWLDYDHTVFGQVFEGIEVVDKISQVKIGREFKPEEDIKILDIEITKYESNE